ncbi:MAG TPA: hypothetical protein VD995_09700 [Azospirillum sp.]|nr:hypothetical protein [Azospirillum sp.]
MRVLFVSAVALAMSMPSMALAQSQQSQQSQQTSTRSYKEVENALKQAGIQDVKTLNAAYLVSAVTKEGEQVTFVVDPPNPASAGSASGQQGDAAKQTALRGQQQVREDLTKGGFTNVQILDAAYLATGKTKSGDQITMMIDPTSSAMTGSSGNQSGSSPSGSSQGGKSQ